jgi:hypothetical protein
MTPTISQGTAALRPSGIASSTLTVGFHVSCQQAPDWTGSGLQEGSYHHRLCMPHLSCPEVDNQKTMTPSAMSQAMTDTVVKVTFGFES